MSGTAATTTVRLLVAAQSAMWSAAERSAYGRWLSESEHARLAQMHSASRRQEFVASRYALRLLLAGGRAQDVAQWPLDAPVGQPPRVNAALADHGLYLSLSHSHGYLACAVAAQPVGVDIEVLARKPRSDLHALAELACMPAERRELLDMPDDEQRHIRFMQWWSLKEAWFKQVQTGVDFALLPRLACVPQHSNASAQSWTVRTAPGHVALLSVYLPGTRLHCDRIDLSDWTWLSAEGFGLHLCADD